MNLQIIRPRVEQEPKQFERRNQLPGNSFARICTAHALAQVRKQPVTDVARELWPNDRAVAHIVSRGASAPAMTTVAGWAAELSQRVVSDALSLLGPMSAAIQVLREGMVLTFDHYGAISAPGFVAGAGSAGFVAEGQPIPVRQLQANPTLLLPHKLCDIAVLTQEMINSSNAETLIGNTLARAQGLALDAALFDANPASAARPAGLRNGISALTPSSNADPLNAVIEDINALFEAVSAVGGPGPYVLVASPGRAMSMRIRMTRYGADAEQLVVGSVIGSPAVGNDVLAIACQALVSAFSPQPEIIAGNAGSLHMSDTPTDLGSAAPAKSMFQTDSVALRLRWPASWQLRNALGLAWLTPTWK